MLIIARQEKQFKHTEIARFKVSFENYFISPRVTKVTMDIHPAVAVFSTIFGAYTAGVIGAVLALPIAATIQGIIEIILLKFSIEIVKPSSFPTT